MSQVAGTTLGKTLWGIAVAAAVAIATQAWAQTAYPTKPIRILVPFAAGGSTDLLARGIGERLTSAWGKPVVIDNRLGADGIVA